MPRRRITIHVRYKPENDKEYFKRKWANTFRIIHEKYGHEVTMNFWRELGSVKVIHDRHMITDQSGIDSGRGFGIVNAESTWKLLSYDVMRQSLNRFEPNCLEGIELAFSLTRHDAPKEEEKDGRVAGVVKKILHDNDKGKVGFIRVEGMEDHYFQISAAVAVCKRLKEGSRVTLHSYLQESGKYRAFDIELNENL